jgi:phosphoribosylamine--glycine ligase
MGEPMNVLVIGSGGREHALVWKLRQSPLVNNLFCVPGNGGISRDAQTAHISLEFKTIENYIREKEIDFILVGPEAPLVSGIADYFRERKIGIFGPGAKPSMLEGSKVFAKNFMKHNNIPTAGFEVFDDSKKAIDYLKTKKGSVIKADGLCAGKGVVVANNFSAAKRAVRDIMESKIFGDAGKKIVIEEKLAGEEASILVLLNGENYCFLISSQDHKPVFDGNKGPNTGGMGAYAPASLIDSAVMEKIDRKIMEPLIQGLGKEGIRYFGVLYLGLMIMDGEPRVLEFNVRFGDPETQAILPLMKNDLMEVLVEVAQGKKIELEWKNGYCVDIALASGGYPGKYEKGKKIFIPESTSENVCLFHAGTELKQDGFYTSGGRVLNVAATGDDIFQARERVYSAVKDIQFEGMHFRRDIGLKEQNRKERI